MRVGLQIEMPFLFQARLKLAAQDLFGIARGGGHVPALKGGFRTVLHREGEILPARVLYQLDCRFIGRFTNPVGKKADIRRKLACHVTGYSVPMPVIENEDCDHLDKDHRDQDDRQHPAEERLWQIVT